MNEIKLGEEQEIAVNLIKKFISESKETAFSLMGYAGTGKSTIIKWLIDYLESECIPYILAAPTHKAKSIINYNTNRPAFTLHQVLKLFPNIELLNLDMRDLEFVMNKARVTEIPYKGVVICDESSMISDALFNSLVNRCKEEKTKIIFVGDPAQLKPVKSLDKSLVFSTPDSFELTKIYRQSSMSGLYQVLPTLREVYIPKFKSIISDEGSLICVSSAKELFENAIPYFKKSIAEGNIFGSKMYAYTNKRTQALNNKLRATLFNDPVPYQIGEILTCYENFSYNFSNYWNSMDYIVDAPTVSTQKYIPHVGLLDGYEVSLYDTAEDSSDVIFILNKNIRGDILFSLAAIIETTRLKALELKANHNRSAQFEWKKYYEIINSFTTPIDLVYDNRVVKKKTFDYGYASTVHKSQGSSINDVFVDMKDINTCRDDLELRQLQYVSISRARENVYILQ